MLTQPPCHNQAHILGTKQPGSSNARLSRRAMLRRCGAAFGVGALALAGGCDDSGTSSGSGAAATSNSGNGSSNGPVFADNYGTAIGLGSTNAPMTVNMLTATNSGDFLVLAVAANGNTGTPNPPGIFSITTNAGLFLPNAAAITVVDPTKSAYLWVYVFPNLASLTSMTIAFSNVPIASYSAVLLEYVPVGGSTLLSIDGVGRQAGNVGSGVSYFAATVSTTLPDTVLAFVAWTAQDALIDYQSPFTATLGVTGRSPSLSPASTTTSGGGQQTMIGTFTNTNSVGAYAAALVAVNTP